MRWEKKGLIYSPDGRSSWVKHSALQPTPILLDDDTIRVFLGFRDDDGRSRIGYIDLDPENPANIRDISKNPVLDIGTPGAFDENGVVPCAAIRRENKIYLYYAGYQLGHKVRFLAFGGLAIGEIDAKSFERYSKCPILDRTDEELYFRAIHSIMFEENKWKVWYGGGNEYIRGKSKSFPKYNIRYMESPDGIIFPNKGQIIINIKNDEYRVGRPYVIKDNALYKMFYCVSSKKIPYRLGYAVSSDGIKWTRKDHEIGIAPSRKGWDSKMIAYPSIIRYKDRVYLFYNGNDYGKTGFGYAVLET